MACEFLPARQSMPQKSSVIEERLGTLRGDPNTWSGRVPRCSTSGLLKFAESALLSISALADNLVAAVALA